MALRKKGKYWYLYYRQGGRIVYKSLRTEDRMEAERNSNAIMAQVRYARHMGAISDMMRRFTVTVDDNRGPVVRLPEPPFEPCPASLVIKTDEPNVDAESDGRSRLPMDRVLVTASKHRKLSDEHVRAFARFAESVGVEYMDEVTQTMALKYMDANFADVSPKRYNNVLTQLNVVFRACLVEAGISVSPFAAILPRVLDSTRHFRAFTREETDAIFGEVETHPYWKCLCTIAYNTGLRLESCQRLCRDMIKDGMITTMPGKTARFGRAVQIPVMQKLAEYLDTIDSGDDSKPFCKAFKVERWYFFKDGRKRMAFFAGVLAKLNIKAEGAFKKVGFPSWRDTYITRLEEENIPEHVIQGIVGHRTKRMLDLYNHDTESARRQRENIERALRRTPEE